MVQFVPKHWKMCKVFTNGATRADKCFDWHLWILGVHFNYTDWDYCSAPNNKPTW